MTEVEDGLLPDYVAKNIYTRLADMHIDQRELAKRLGSEETWVSRLLNQRGGVKLVTLQRIANVLGLTLAELFTNPEAQTVCTTPGELMLWMGRFTSELVRHVQGVLDSSKTRASIVEDLLTNSDLERLLGQATIERQGRAGQARRQAKSAMSREEAAPPPSSRRRRRSPVDGSPGD